MAYVPCPKRVFPLRINYVTYYPTYLRWLKHLIERLGYQQTLSLWKGAFAAYDDRLLLSILSAGVRDAKADECDQLADRAEALPAAFFPAAGAEPSHAEVRKIIEETPPIAQIKQLFCDKSLEKEMSAYDALHIRFDGFAHLAESLIDIFGKEGELIVYDIMREERLAAGQGRTGSVAEFIEYFTSEPDTPSLLTAGLQMEVISKSAGEAIAFVRECEWARYFRERHPRVGYLMACSTDEAEYRAFNPSLRLRRTGTIMEGSDCCDFMVYAVELPEQARAAAQEPAS